MLKVNAFFFNCNSICPTAEVSKMVGKHVRYKMPQMSKCIYQYGLYLFFFSFFFLRVLRYDRSCDPSASVGGVLWSETGQREKPEPLILQQIWQLLCKDWGKMRLMLNLVSFLWLQTETVSFPVTKRKLGAYTSLQCTNAWNKVYSNVYLDYKVLVAINLWNIIEIGNCQNYG